MPTRRSYVASTRSTGSCARRAGTNDHPMVKLVKLVKLVKRWDDETVKRSNWSNGRTTQRSNGETAAKRTDDQAVKRPKRPKMPETARNGRKCACAPARTRQDAELDRVVKMVKMVKHGQTWSKMVEMVETGGRRSAWLCGGRLD
jgi:hypothetical protein